MIDTNTWCMVVHVWLGKEGLFVCLGWIWIALGLNRQRLQKERPRNVCRTPGNKGLLFWCGCHALHHRVQCHVFWQLLVTVENDDLSTKLIIIFIIELGIWVIRACANFIRGCHVFWQLLVTIENDDVSTNWLSFSSLSLVYGSY